MNPRRFLRIMLVLALLSSLIPVLSGTALGPGFGLAFTALALLAIPTCLALLRRTQALEVRRFAAVMGTPVVAVTYVSSRAARWRGNLWAFRHSASLLALAILWPLLAAAGISARLARYSPAAALLGFPLLVVLALVVSVALHLLVTAIVIELRAAFKGGRPVTTALTPQGILDEGVIPWTSVVRIACHGGDIYVQATGGIGCYVPREAFRDVEARRGFHEVAQSLWSAARVAPPREDAGRVEEAPQRATSGNAGMET